MNVRFILGPDTRAVTAEEARQLEPHKVMERLLRAGAKPVIRLSQRQVLYQYKDGTRVVYNRAQKRLEPAPDLDPVLRVGDSVQWSLNNGRRYEGVIVCIVQPGVSVEKLLQLPALRGKYNFRPVMNLSPRGQISYLVAVAGKDGETLYLPPVSKLRKSST